MLPGFPQLPSALLAIIVAVEGSAAADFDLSTTTLTDRSFAVEVSLRVGGDLLVREAGATGPDADVTKLPMSTEGKLAYEEQHLSADRTARYYDRAEATIKVEKGGKTPRLDDDRRLVVTRLIENDPPVVSSPNGPLSREELDLINVIGHTALLDQLLPGEKLAQSETWQVDAQVMGPLLGMQEVTICEVANVVDEGNASHVKFQIAGTVHGTVEGAQTEFDIRGLGLFSVAERCVTRLNLAVKEKRAPGPATPGFEGVAKVNIKRTPLAAAQQLTPELLARASGAAQPDADLVLDSKDLGMRLVHDRHWYLASQTRRSLSLRRVEQGGLVAQATLTRVPSKKRENHPTLDRFESEVRQTLGEATAELVSSEQWTSSTGCRCLGVVVRGKAQDLEIEQRHYLIMPEGDGHAIALAATLAVGDMAAVGNADRLLADTMVLLEKPAEVAQQPAETQQK